MVLFRRGGGGGGRTGILESSAVGEGVGVHVKLNLLPGGRGGAAKARERLEESAAQQYARGGSGSGSGTVREMRQWQCTRGKGKVYTSSIDIIT